MDGACHELATDGIVVCEKRLSQSRRTHPRESCAATATRRIAFQEETAQSPTSGPHLLGLVIEVVVELAFSSNCRPTRNCSSLAQTGIQVVLALEVPTQRAGAPEGRDRNPQTHTPHVPRESVMGRTEGSFRTYSARLRSFRNDRGQVHDPWPKTTLTNLAHVS